MAQEFTLEDFADHMEQAADKLEAALLWVEHASLTAAESEAHQLSGGPFSLQQLAKMGHPYAAAHPDPPDDEAIINRQSGRFDESWQIVMPEADGDTITSQVTNDAPEGAFMDGTSLMIRRPIVERLDERTRDVHASRVEIAITETLTNP